MVRRMPKIYGEYKTTDCPFCGKQAHFANKAKLPVCKDHKDTEYPSYRCPCGDWIDIKSGRFGTYGSCMRCGNVQLSKILEHNGIID